MSYNASKATVIALNVRKFESEIGGRDIVAGNNVEDRNHLLPLYVYDAKAKEYKMLSKTEGRAYMKNDAVGSALNSDNLKVNAKISTCTTETVVIMQTKTLYSWL